MCARYLGLHAIAIVIDLKLLAIAIAIELELHAIAIVIDLDLRARAMHVEKDEHMSIHGDGAVQQARPSTTAPRRTRHGRSMPRQVRHATGGRTLPGRRANAIVSG